MKKLLFFISSIILISCSNDNDIALVPKIQEKSQNSEIRSYEEALQVALSSMEILNGSTVTRSSSERRIDLNESKVYLRSGISRSSSNVTNDTLMYVFNFADDAGFAIVAAPRNTEALIAVTEKGRYTPGESSGIAGFDEFMALAEKYVSSGTRLHEPTEPIDTLISIEVVTEETDTIVGPFISVNWGQSIPEGELCPNNNPGCANIAIAQIMSYYEYPSTISITYPDAGVTTQSLNWPAMRNHTTLPTYCPDPDAHLSISRLLRQIGHLTNSSYDNPSFTYTNRYDIPPAISSLGYYGGSFANYSAYYVRNQLDNNHLLLILGYSEGDGGHAWNIDGYRYHKTTHYFYQSVANGPWILQGISNIEQHYNHFNWGLCGINNGYFASGVYDETMGVQYDGSFNVGTGNYEYNVQLVNMYRN